MNLKELNLLCLPDDRKDFASVIKVKMNENFRIVKPQRNAVNKIIRKATLSIIFR